MTIPRMQYCFNCGAELGVYHGNDGRDTCGALKCNRAARNDYAREREDAHEQLDRDMGYY